MPATRSIRSPILRDATGDLAGTRSASQNAGGRDMQAAIILFSFILLALLWGALFHRLRVEREDVIRTAVEQNDTLATALEEYALRTIESADTVIRYLIREKERAPANLDLGKFVSDFPIDNQTIAGLVLVDEFGNGLTTATATATGTAREPAQHVQLSDREHFRVHVARDSHGLFIGKPVIGRVTGKTVIPLTRRINKRDGSFGGVAMAVVEPKRFVDVFKDTVRHSQDIVSLVGLDGITRARLTGNRESAGQDIRSSRLIKIRAVQPVGNFYARGAIDGVPRYFSYRTLRNFAVVATVGTAEADVLAEFDQRKARYLWIAGLFSAFVITATVLLLATLARQRRAAVQAMASRARAVATFDQPAVGIVHSGVDERIQDVNQKFCDLLGYQRDELMNCTIVALTHPDDIQASRQVERALLDRGRDEPSMQLEKRFLQKDGRTLWCEMAMSIVYDDSGAPDYFVGIVLDVSERKVAEAAMRAYETEQDRLSRQLAAERAQLIEAQAIAKLGSWETELVTMRVTWSAENYRIFGVDPESFSPTHPKFLELVHPDDRAMVDAAFLDSLGGGGRSEVEHRIVLPDGRIRFVAERWRIFSDPDGRPVRAVGTTQDITERKRAEDALRTVNRSLRSLSGRLLRAEENERRRISRELHDQLGQELTALALDLAALAKRSGTSPQPVERCRSAVARLIEEVRDLSLTLRPAQLDDLGLVAALRGHAHYHVEAHGIKVHLDTEGTVGRLPADIEAACFRIVQEALTNVLRYAKASNVWLAVRRAGSEIALVVKDDGEGFDVEAAMERATAGRSSGLRNLHDRAELAGGTLRIESAPGRGTTVSLRIVLPGAEDRSQ